MITRAALALTVAACLPAGLSAGEPPARMFAVLSEFDRMAAQPLWPGFQPAAVPLEIWDGRASWLVRHPRPPLEFAEVAGHVGVRVFHGRHESLRANASVELGGVATATASFPEGARDLRLLAALLLHEAFHVFEARRHSGWGGNEAELFVYPVEDVEGLALRRLESKALERALAAQDKRDAASWAARALGERQSRFERLPAPAAAYERGTESKEGLARYIEIAAAGGRETLFPREEFAPADVRGRAYASGCAIALLLDRLAPDWKQALEARDAPLDEMLGRAVGKASPARFSPAEREAARRRASGDVAAWTRSRFELRRDFLERSGWKLIVESRAPLFPQRFDPLNVERLSASEVLHKRFLRLGNAAGVLETLDLRCLTESAGGHPLFEGVKRVTVAGLLGEPAVEESGRGVKVSAPGVTLWFRGARATRSERAVTVVVGPAGS